MNIPVPPEAIRSCKNDLMGATPVPGPTSITGVLMLDGSVIVPFSISTAISESADTEMLISKVYRTDEPTKRKSANPGCAKTLTWCFQRTSVLDNSHA